MAKTETINQKSARLGFDAGFRWGSLVLYDDLKRVVWFENLPSTFLGLTEVLNDGLKNSDEVCRTAFQVIESKYGKLDEQEYVLRFILGAFDYYRQVWGWLDKAKARACHK